MEPNPDLVQEIKKRRRHAALLPNCLATGTTSEIVEFDASSAYGGIINEGGACIENGFFLTET